MLSEHIFFVIERITDILKLEEEKKVELSHDVKRKIGELRKELSRIYDRLRDVEPKYDYNLHEQQFYLNLSFIVDSSDDILDRVMTNDNSSDESLVGVTSNDDVAHGIDTLLEKIRNSYNPSSTQLNINLSVIGNTSYDSQTIGNPSITINNSEPSKNKKYSRPKSYGHVPNPKLVGFHHEIETLLIHLQPPDETRVVGIVGPAGSGKTTLARHIYQLPQINNHFTHKAWVCVSQFWDKTVILEEILIQVGGTGSLSCYDYVYVVYELSKFLSSGETYLVIIDDIWSIDAWNGISPALPDVRGSKIVITTRDKFLPLGIERSVFIIETKTLNDKDSYELFMKRASFDKDPPHELLSLGEEMVKKCKGLPLAIVALAGVLGKEKRPHKWERIRKRVTDNILTTEIESTQGVVKEILALSYYELPYHLKPCALYLSVFPEDYVIETQKLIQVWIAEHFMDEESIAEEYLDEMAQRYIVEVVKTNYKGQVCQLRIHDLIRQMLIDIDSKRNILKNSSLRLVLRTNTLPDYGSSHVRSLVFFDFRRLENLMLRPLFINLKLLRVLILGNIRWHELPENIGNLIHLRYLEFGVKSYLFPQYSGNLEDCLSLGRRNNRINKVQVNFEKMKELKHLYMLMDE